MGFSTIYFIKYDDFREIWSGRDLDVPEVAGTKVEYFITQQKCFERILELTKRFGNTDEGLYWHGEKLLCHFLTVPYARYEARLSLIEKLNAINNIQ